MFFVHIMLKFPSISLECDSEGPDPDSPDYGRGTLTIPITIGITKTHIKYKSICNIITDFSEVWTLPRQGRGKN